MTGCIRNDKALKIFAEYEENEIVRAEKYPEAPFELSYETKEKIRSTGEMLSEKKKPSLFARKGLMAATVIIIALIVSLAVSPEVRAFVGNIIVTIKENCIEFRSEKNVEWDGAEFELGYLPEGYEFGSVEKNKNDVRKNYINGENVIVLEVSKMINSLVDNESENFKILYLNDSVVYLNGDQSSFMAVWEKKGFFFQLATWDRNIGEDEFIKIIEQCSEH